MNGASIGNGGSLSIALGNKSIAEIQNGRKKEAYS